MSVRVPLLLLSLLLPGLAVSEDVDPPGRVARVSYLKGDVTFQAADGQTPEDAVINRPATSGDRLMTGDGSRSELTLGIAALRLDERTDLSIANLDEDIAQFDINSGTVGIHVRELQAGHTFEIDTPNSAIRLLEPGDYRVDVEADGTVIVSVREGRAEIDSGNGVTEVREGDQAQLAASDRNPELHRLGSTDSFDRWAEERERQLNGQESSRYVSREVVGYEDLDEYGDWRVEPEYGAVWYPTRVVVGWSPYRYGRWSWVSPWGWTWIDNSPWGFAPFHYGRWAHVRDRWCWVPGPRHYRPVYAPALVGWVGDPYSGVSVSIGTGPVGWFPLGPREVYVPYRRVSPRYLRNVNVSNTVIVNNTYITNVSRNRVRNIHYANRAVPGAVTTMPRREFDSRRPDREQREWRANRDNNPARNFRGNSNTERDARGGNRDRNDSRTIDRDRNRDNASPGSFRANPAQRDARGNTERRTYSTGSIDRSSINRNGTDRSNQDRRANDGNSTDRSVNRRSTERGDNDRGQSFNRGSRPNDYANSNNSSERRTREWRSPEPARAQRPEFNRSDVQRQPEIQRRNHAYRIPEREAAQTNRAPRIESNRESRREQQRPRTENRSFENRGSVSRPPQQPRMENRPAPSAQRQYGRAVPQGNSGGGQEGRRSNHGQRRDQNTR